MPSAPLTWMLLVHEIIFATVAAIITGVVTWLTTNYQHSKSRTDTVLNFAMQQSTVLQQRVDRLEDEKKELNTTVLNQARQLDELVRKLDAEYNPTRVVFSAYRHLPFPVWVTNAFGHIVFVNLSFEQQWQTNLLRVQQQPGLSIWPEEVAEILSTQQQLVMSRLQAARNIVAIPIILDQAISELNPLEQWEVTMAPVAIQDQIYGAFFLGRRQHGVD